jgi:agmatinase
MECDTSYFGGLDNQFRDYGKARFVVVPVPYEHTTTYVKGARNGPKAILEASANMELYDEEYGFIPAEAGIATAEPVVVDDRPEAMVEEVRRRVSAVLGDGKFPVVLGGEHSVTVGVFKAVKEAHPNASVLQLDAHTDLRDTYNGSKLNHACVMARIREMADAVQVGVRSVSEEEVEPLSRHRKTIIHAREVLSNDVSRRILRALTGEVYVTVDCDVFDPSIMPSVGTPEPGGLGWYDVTDILKAVVGHKRVVGFDVVELCPNAHNMAPDFTAAKLVYKIIGQLSNSFLKKHVK